METDQFFATSESDFRRIRLSVAICAMYVLTSVALRLVTVVGSIRQGSIAFYAATALGIAATAVTWVGLIRVFLQRPINLKSLGFAFLLGTSAFLFCLLTASLLDPLLAAWMR